MYLEQNISAHKGYGRKGLGQKNPKIVSRNLWTVQRIDYEDEKLLSATRAMVPLTVLVSED